MPSDWQDRLHDFRRLRTLAGSALLDSPAEERFDRYTQLAARILGVPIAFLSLVDDKRQFFKSAVGLEGALASSRETPLSHSFCKYAVCSGQPLIVQDAHTHPLVHDNPAVEEFGVVAYAGVPIELSGEHVGVLCAVDRKPRMWTEQDLHTLRTLAAALKAEIELATTQRLLSALTASKLDSIVVTDADGSIVFCNSALEAMFCRTRAELVGRDVTVLMPERYRDAHRAGLARLKRGEPSRVGGRVVELHGAAM